MRALLRVTVPTVRLVAVGLRLAAVNSYAVQKCCLLSVDATHLTTAEEEEEALFCFNLWLHRKIM